MKKKLLFAAVVLFCALCLNGGFAHADQLTINIPINATNLDPGVAASCQVFFDAAPHIRGKEPSGPFSRTYCTDRPMVRHQER
jgi:hypothetical protein